MGNGAVVEGVNRQLRVMGNKTVGVIGYGALGIGFSIWKYGS
jgi:phosphoglycerate dehydrogenase-like enzyme